MKKFIYLLFAFALVLGLNVQAQSGTINVDQDGLNCVGGGQGDPYSVVYCKIQDAIDDAADGDTINVADGDYGEKLTVSEKSLTIASNDGPKATKIKKPDGIGAASTGATIYLEEEPNNITIEGFTIQDGTDSGLNCYNCGSVIVKNCLIILNSAGSGGGIYTNNSSLKVQNCTIADNSADDAGGAIKGRVGSTIEVVNSILWNNTGPDEISNDQSSTITVTYSDVEGWWPGVGNKNENPRLKRPGGCSTKFYQLEAGSPCIDAGCYDDQNGDCAYEENEPEPDGCRVNMGAYGNTSLSTKSPDSDADGWGNPSAIVGSSQLYPCDNCPTVYNPGQENSDTGPDSHGDACDNCPNHDNEDQANSDSDSYGNACDNCWDVNNEQQDVDNDCSDAPYSSDPQCGDGCDNCSAVANAAGQGTCGGCDKGTSCTSDADCPGVLGFCSMAQEDADEDGSGDVCDCDSDDDGVDDGAANCTDGACDDNCLYTPNGPAGSGKGTCIYRDAAYTILISTEATCMSPADCPDEYYTLYTCDIDQSDNALDYGGADGIGVACECPADLDGDGDVDVDDNDVYLAHFGRGPYNNPCALCVTGSSITYPVSNACTSDADCDDGNCAPNPENPCKGDFNCDGGVGGNDSSIQGMQNGKTHCASGYNLCEY